MGKTKAKSDLIYNHPFITSSCILLRLSILSGRCFFSVGVSCSIPNFCPGGRRWLGRCISGASCVSIAAGSIGLPASEVFAVRIP